jgi:putative hydrolase of the HAD superfamily
MIKPTITDVFFDLDHTLWDFDRNSALALDRVFQRFSVGVPLASFLKVYEPINFNYWREFREERVTKTQLRRGRLIDSFSELGEAFDMQTIDGMSEAYIEELPNNNYLFDGTFELLGYLKEKYTLHIITNGFSQVQFIKLKKSKLAPFFATVTSSEEVGVKKPNPLVFTTALAKAGATAQSSIMIGDTFDADVLGAEGVGMDTIFFNYRKEIPKNGYKVVDYLLEIKDLL